LAGRRADRPGLVADPAAATQKPGPGPSRGAEAKAPYPSGLTPATALLLRLRRPARGPNPGLLRSMGPPPHARSGDGEVLPVEEDLVDDPHVVPAQLAAVGLRRGLPGPVGMAGAVLGAGGHRPAD